MAIQGKESTKGSGSYSKYVGMFNANVVAVNPTKEELGKLLGTELEKDIEYMSVSDTGAKKLTLSFWLHEPKLNQHFNVRFGLEDTVVESKTGKTQFINSIGSTSYAEDKSSLQDWFTAGDRDIRVAKKGEQLLYDFLRNWLSNLDYTDPSTELSLDWKKLMSGKVNELKDAIENFSNQMVCSMAVVRIAEDGKEYQGVYPYGFLPYYALDCFTGAKASNYKSVDKFIQRVTDPEYGCKDFYKLTPIAVYDPKQNVITQTNEPIIKKQSVELVATETLDDNLPF